MSPISRRPGSAVALLAALALTLPLAACAEDEEGAAASPSAVTDDSSPGPSDSAEAGGLGGDLVVFAAASLTGAFTELGETFQAEHPEVNVEFSFAGSSTLAAQINEAAPADVFASASPATMDTVTEAGSNAADPEVFTSNTLQIAVPEGNPGGVDALADFADADLDLAVCAPEVPCGAAAEQVFRAAGVDAAPDSQESDAKAVLTKVELGEVDAGLVYTTDVAAAAGDKVEGVEFPEAQDAVNDYLIATLKESGNPDAASAWVEFMFSEEAQRVLAEAGFGRP